jgi:hypothetical protein
MKNIFKTLLLTVCVSILTCEAYSQAPAKATIKNAVKATGEQAAPQNPPVKGIGVVVKKNPGSGASIQSVTNTEGVTTFEITENGNYTFTLTLPTTNAVVAKGAGTGVRAVKVGLGKNPPGAIIAYQVPNENGEVSFNSLAPGSYFIKIEAAEKAETMPVKNAK